MLQNQRWGLLQSDFAWWTSESWTIFSDPQGVAVLLSPKLMGARAKGKWSNPDRHPMVIYPLTSLGTSLETRLEALEVSRKSSEVQLLCVGQGSSKAADFSSQITRHGCSANPSMVSGSNGMLACGMCWSTLNHSCATFANAQTSVICKYMYSLHVHA